MKLNLNFNGAQSNPAVIQQVIAAMGGNTSLIINTAQSITQPNLVAICNAAGATKSLSIQINGAQTSQSFVEGVLAALGANSSLSINTAQALSIAALVSIAGKAGSKRLRADFNGAQNSGSVVQQFLNAAGPNTTTSVNTAQAFSPAELSAMYNTAGVKSFSTQFNGAQSSALTIQQALASAGTNTTIGINTAQSFSPSEWSGISASAGAKRLSPDFNGAQTNLSLLQQVLNAAGANTSMSINTAQSVGQANLVALCNAAGGKRFSVDINSAQSSVALLQSVVAAAGANTTVSINTAQSITLSSLTNLLSSAGSKNINLGLNSSQMAAAYLTSVINAAGINTTANVDVAHIYTAAQLISFVQAAG